MAKGSKGKGRARDSASLEPSRDDSEPPPEGPAKKRGGKRNVAAEFEAAYASPEDFQRNVDLRKQETTRRILSPRTAANHEQILKHFTNFLAASLALQESGTTLQDAQAALQEGAELPDIDLVIEFLAFWIKGGVGRISKQQQLLSVDTLRRYAANIQSAIQRAVLKTYKKEDVERLRTFVYNAPRQNPPLVTSERKVKTVITLQEARQLLHAAFDQLNGPFLGRTRVAQQACLFWLICYHFGPRPGSLCLLPEYEGVPGETQSLLWKDVNVQFEGLASAGYPQITVVFTLRWMKGMRNHASENLVVRASSMEPSMAEFDIVNYILAIAIDRDLFALDVKALLANPQAKYSERSPLAMPFKTEASQLPVFCANLAPYRQNTGKGGQQTAKRAKAEPVSCEGGLDLESFGYKLDYDVPAKVQWALTVTREMGSALGWSGLTSYTFRRSFAETVKTQVASEYMKYLMGHRADSKMVDRRYVSDGRLSDITAARFGQVQRTLVPRNSVGYGGSARESDQAETRIAGLLLEIEDMKVGLEKQFGSLDQALAQESHEDVQALLDTMAILKGDLSTSTLIKLETPEPPEMPGIGVIPPLPPMPAPTSSSEKEFETFKFGDWLHFPNEPEIEEQGSTSSAQPSKPAVATAKIASLIDGAGQEAQHILSIAAQNGPSHLSTLRSVRYLLDRLTEQRMVEGGVCKICFECTPEEVTSHGNNANKHTYRCETEFFEDSHQRCGFCNELVNRSFGKDALLSHFNHCKIEWESECKMRQIDDPKATYTTLHQPLVIPHASFFHPTEKSHSDTQISLCPLCVQADFTINNGGSTDSVAFPLPYLLTNDLEVHLLTHFQVSKQKSDARLDWETSYGCFAMGCTTSGTLKTLLPHWHTNHGPRLLVNSAGKALVDSAVPASLSAGIKYLRDLSEEDAPDTIYIKSRKSKKKGAKRDAEEADVQSERE